MASGQSARLRSSVPSSYVGMLFDYLAWIGEDAEAMLGEPRPSSGPMGIARVPMAHWRRLLETASERLGDPALGLRVGKMITPEHVGALANLLLSSGTIGIAIDRYLRYERLFYDRDTVQRSERDGLGRIEWKSSRGGDGPLVDECAIAALVQFTRDLADEPIPLVSVHFTHEAPADIEPHKTFFACPVHFGEPTTAIVAELAMLSLPVVPSNFDAGTARDSTPQPSVESQKLTDDIVRDVRRVILRLLGEGEPTIERTAETLGLSPRTLNRRLEAEGTTFRNLLDEDRRRIALEQLREPTQSLAEIAHSLGYSDQSAFTRAFKRWTGIAPVVWRRNHGRRG